MVFWIKASVTGSTLAVASSSTKILFLLTIALARHSNCFWPALKLLPLWSIDWSRDEKALLSSTSWRADHNAASANSWNGSRLSLNEAENNIGSCGMMDKFLRKSTRPILFVSTPSMYKPPSMLAKRKRAVISDDLPAPVLPTIPT